MGKKMRTIGVVGLIVAAILIWAYIWLVKP